MSHSSHVVVTDPNSFSNCTSIRVQHFHLNLFVDFAQSSLIGTTRLDLVAEADAVSQVILDSNHLKVDKVEQSTSFGSNDVQAAPLKFSFGAAHEAFGTPLIIELNAPVNKGQQLSLVIHYATSPSASAIQWLPPAQTAGKVHPYLFTQCQAIHARSLMPCMDTPSIKSTYSADVTVEKPLVPLMSALREGEAKPSTTHGEKFIVQSFTQKVPIPSYLTALAVGALESRKLGPRSHVWSEKETVDAGAYEFADTERFLAEGEKICGPYAWGQYDILLLPPSFPYGGMENPCLTFVTPTLLAGDRSLASVVIHEICHSFFGNLVTSQTWEHFWMNEGFTVFLERKIVGAIKGKAHQDLHAIIGWNDLQKSVDHFGHDHGYTCLHVHLTGVDPDDAFSSVPYEKGFNFLCYLESLVGGPELMNPFLRAHCDRFANSVVNCFVWKEFFLNYFKDKVAAEKLDSIDWGLWLDKPGMPPVKPDFDQSLVAETKVLAKKVLEDVTQIKKEDIQHYDSSQTVVFLETLVDAQAALSAEEKTGKFVETLNKLDDILSLSSSKNSEIRLRWCTLVVRSQIVAKYEVVTKFLLEQGRMKFIRPLYRELFTNGGEAGKTLAVDTFKKHGSMYHSIAQKMVAKDLELA